MFSSIVTGLNRFSGQGDFFKVHKDTPRGENIFGSLVVVLPTRHEGGQFVLRQTKEWTIDFTDKFANATEPSVCFIAFYGDIEHEVLPITSGHRVTLMYNLYHKSIHPTTSSIPTPFYLNLGQALADLVNNTSKRWVFQIRSRSRVRSHRAQPSWLLGRPAKGSDRALADACVALGVPYSLRLLSRNIGNRSCIFLPRRSSEYPKSCTRNRPSTTTSELRSRRKPWSKLRVLISLDRDRSRVSARGFLCPWTSF